MSSVQVERKEQVALLRLNEPQSMNALSATIKEGLESQIPALLADPDIRALVITGAGRAFCAGGDIRTMHDRVTLNVRSRLQRNYGWAQRLLTCEKPVIMAVNGVAAGAGFALALLGDIILAADAARFKAGFPGLGAVPDIGLAYTLPRAVGFLRAKEILLTNRTIEVAEAAAIGLVNHVHPAADLMSAALAMAADLAAGPVSLGLTKSMMRRAYDDTLERFLEGEAQTQAVAFGSEDFAEGVAAFLGKRKPSFKGR